MVRAAMVSARVSARVSAIVSAAMEPIPTTGHVGPLRSYG